MKTFWILELLLAAFIAVSIILLLRVRDRAAPFIFERVEELPSERLPRTALVLGAAVRPDGEPTPILRRRIEAAVRLLKEGKVQNLLLSGNDLGKFKETPVMKKTAVALGVEEARLILDGGSLRTYDSCLRAKKVYGLDRIVVVTQRFHLPRSLFLCRTMGIDALGFSAEGENGFFSYPNLREILGLWRSLLDLYVFRPK
jgi:vancomycin permeability regulator SanA